MSHLFKTPVDKDYPTCHECSASFCIISPIGDPYDWTTKLAINPDRVHRKGDVFTNAIGKQRSQKLNGWFLESEGFVKSKDLRDHLDYVLDKLIPAREALIDMQELNEITMTISCHWWGDMHSGPVLWPKQLKKLSQLNVEVEFFFASYDDDKDDAL